LKSWNYLIYPFILFSIIFYSCATQTTPTGGPKDTIPPILIRSNPVNNSTNFKQKTIELSFNEWVVLNSPREQVLFSPSVGKEVEFIAQKTKVTLTPKNGWRDSTTYNISFREGIKDITEGNSPKNLKLSFSTGPIIDSLKIFGKINDALSGKELDKITVAIYKSDTFNVFEDIPEYWTESDQKGRFSINNLPAGKYWIYAYQDKNKNLILESKTESYGFIANRVSTVEQKDSLEISLITLDSRPLKISHVKNLGEITRLTFNKFITNYNIQTSKKTVYSYGDHHDEIIFWNPPTDSTEIKISATDSLNFKIDSTFYIKNIDTKYIKDAFLWSIEEATLDPKTQIMEAKCFFSKPIISINYDSLFIKLDSLHNINFLPKELTIDTIAKTFSIKKIILDSLHLDSIKTPLKLDAGKGFLISIDNDSSKAQNTTITKVQTDNKTCNIEVEVTTEAKDYFIELLLKNNTKQPLTAIAVKKNVTKFSFDNLQPGTYQIRAVTDVNKNDVWDWGNIYDRIEPEKITMYKASDGSTDIPIRENWTVGPLSIKF